MFSARYGLIPYIKQITFRLQKSKCSTNVCLLTRSIEINTQLVISILNSLTEFKVTASIFYKLESFQYEEEEVSNNSK